MIILLYSFMTRELKGFDRSPDLGTVTITSVLHPSGMWPVVNAWLTKPSAMSSSLPYMRNSGGDAISVTALPQRIAFLACRNSSLEKGSSEISRVSNTVGNGVLFSLIFGGLPNRFLKWVYQSFACSSGLWAFSLLHWAQFQPEMSLINFQASLCLKLAWACSTASTLLVSSSWSMIA